MNYWWPWVTKVRLFRALKSHAESNDRWFHIVRELRNDNEKLLAEIDELEVELHGEPPDEREVYE